jgi:hypothetical protein
MPPGWQAAHDLNLLSLNMRVKGKFIREFKQMDDNKGIKAKPTTSQYQQTTSKWNH